MICHDRSQDSLLKKVNFELKFDQISLHYHVTKVVGHTTQFKLSDVQLLS